MTLLQGALVRLRPATHDDVVDLARIRRAPAVLERWRGGDDMAAEVAADLDDPDVTAYVIEVDGAVAGLIQWEAEDDPDYRHAGIDLYVDPAMHGRGVGTDAVRTLARHLFRDHGHHRLTIDPAADNAPAIRAYAKAGFRPVGIMRRYERGADGTWHDNLLMDLLADEFTDHPGDVMPAATTFTDVTAPVPDLDALAARIGDLRASLAAGTTADACLDAVRTWDGLRRQVDTYGALVHLRFNQDTTDAERKAAREAWDEAAPRWTELEVSMKRALLDHPLRPQLERSLGSQAFALWESDVLAFDPAIKEDLAHESKLGAEYVELLASAELSFAGEQLNLSSIQKYRQSGERDLRHGAERVTWEWFAANGEALDRIYDELVHLRASMAKQLGFEDFTGLGYRRMCRVDYDRADVERLRAGVREHVVPFAAELRRRQAATLGLEHLYEWDEAVHDPKGSPAPGGDHDWMLGRAREMFDAMGEFGPFFRRMDDGGFLDLANRKGKAGGGFCTSFPTHGMPFVYANFNGTKGDVEVFTHEMGHAFQAYKSRELALTDYLWPTFESAEIHSMSLEFLTGPHMERFFGPEAERFRRTHLVEAVVFLPYGTAVDHFQHEIYAHPDMTPAERHDLWREMERTYLPWRDWGDLAYPAKGGRWQQQRHIYLMPFYYIDYVLAQTCALQFWVKAEADRDAAMRDYVALCERGGAAPFQALVRSAGLTTPFDDGCLAEVVGKARAALGS